MSYNGSGTFNINSTGQPVVTGTVISSTAFNALTSDLATGLTTAITKDGQTATTVRIPFAQGINSTLVTDATSSTTGSIITAGGISCQKALVVGTTVASGANTITSTSANALAVGSQGATNPVLNVDASTASTATGLNLKGAAAAGGMAVTVISSGTNENLSIDAKGSGTITLNGTATGGITLTRATTMSSTATATAFIPSSSSVPTNGMFLPAANNLGFSTNSSEVARFGSDGSLNIGTVNIPASPALIAKSSGGGGGTYAAEIYNRNLSNTGSAYGLLISAGYNGSSSPILINFIRPDSTALGSINQSGSGGVSYNSASDYRLKENVQPLKNSLGKISALSPVTYDWVIDKTPGEGFIAHELQEIIPAAVTGEKDAVNSDGSIKPQGVDYSKIVPHLVAAIQELVSRIELLEAK